MGINWRIPAGHNCVPYSYVRIVGLLEKQPVVGIVVGEHKKIVRFPIVVGMVEFSVVAYDNTAQEVAQCEPGAILHIEGRLQQQHWTVGDAGDRSRLDILCLRFHKVCQAETNSHETA